MVVLRWLILRVPLILTLALPIGCLLATSLLVIRMGRDGEIVAWRMGGVSIRRLFRPFLLGGAAVSLLALLNNELLAPRYRVKANEVLLQRILQGPGSGVKTDMPLLAGDDAVVHVGRVDLRRSEMYFVLVYRFHDGRPQEALCAPRCVKENGRWMLCDGQHNWFDEDGRLSRTERFDRYPAHLDPNIARLWESDLDAEFMSAVDLWRRARLYASTGERDNLVRMRYYFQTKFSLPLTCLVFTLLAAPLSLRYAGPKSHPFAGVLLSIVVVFFCNGTINWARAIALSGPQAWIPPEVAAWIHVVVFGGLAFVLAWRSEH